MRFNEAEIAMLASQTPEWEGCLQFKPPKGSSGGFGVVNRVSNDYKERWFRLRVNCLFYWRINSSIDRPSPSSEPLGCIVLEGSHVQQEGFAESVHAFSLIFNDESTERKYMFLAESQRQVEQWVSVLKRSKYEVLRRKLVDLQIKLVNRTGRDPLLGTGFEKNPIFNVKLPQDIPLPRLCSEPDDKRFSSPKPKPRKSKVKSTFQSHVVESWETIQEQNGQKEDERVRDDHIFHDKKKASFKSHVKEEENLIDFS